MSQGMKKFLDKLIANHPEHSPSVQIIFQPGAASNAGVIRKVEGNDEMYEMGTFVTRGNIPQHQVKKEDLIQASMYFASDAVQRVMMVPEEKMVQPAGSGIVVPGRH
jgi:hypothetical protein